ncbi:unnamed protein product, partial [Ascophyllum nodosum]
MERNGNAPICAMAAARRARALQKCRKLNTWVRQLVEEPFIHRCRTWVTGTNTWMNKYAHRALSRCLVKLVWRREERVRKCPSGIRYLAADYEESRLTRTKTGGYPQLSIGIALIIKCRLGGFWGAKRMAFVGLIPRGWARKCPCCDGRHQETLQHALLECSRW